MTDAPPAEAESVKDDEWVDPNEAPQGLDDPAALRTELEKVRREAAKYRTENRDLRPLADKAREMEEASKTEVQKLTDAAAQAVADATEARTELARLKVATTKGLPPELAGRLQGATEEEMAEDADRLLAVMKPAAPATPPPGSADGGARGAVAPGQLTRDALKDMTPDQIVDAKAKGLLNDALGITNT